MSDEATKDVRVGDWVTHRARSGIWRVVDLTRTIVMVEDGEDERAVWQRERILEIRHATEG